MENWHAYDEGWGWEGARLESGHFHHRRMREAPCIECVETKLQLVHVGHPVGVERRAYTLSRDGGHLRYGGFKEGAVIAVANSIDGQGRGGRPGGDVYVLREGEGRGGEDGCALISVGREGVALGVSLLGGVAWREAVRRHHPDAELGVESRCPFPVVPCRAEPGA